MWAILHALNVACSSVAIFRKSDLTIEKADAAGYLAFFQSALLFCIACRSPGYCGGALIPYCGECKLLYNDANDADGQPICIK